MITLAIQPVIHGAKKHSGDMVEDVICANALHVASQIRSATPILAESVQNGKVTVVAAKYNLKTGVVEMLQ